MILPLERKSSWVGMFHLLFNVNRGKDHSPDFFPLTKFRSKYYRPDIIEKILEIGNEADTISKTNEDSGRKNETSKLKDHYPPVIEIISPKSVFKTSNKQVTIRYKVRTPSGNPVTGIRVLINGRPNSGTRGLSLVSTETESETKTIKVEIPETDCTISLIAQSKYNSSNPANLEIDWLDKKEEVIEKPRLFILAVGVSDYNDESLKLKYASKDASDFVSLMLKQEGGMYKEIFVKTLLNKEANTSNILDGLDWIQKETKSSDYAMIFLSGHGVNDSLGHYYFLPSNFEQDKFKRTGVSYVEIKNTLNSIRGKVVFFGDTCHSANVFGKNNSTELSKYINPTFLGNEKSIIFHSDKIGDKTNLI